MTSRSNTPTTITAASTASTASTTWKKKRSDYNHDFFEEKKREDDDTTTSRGSSLRDGDDIVHGGVASGSIRRKISTSSVGGGIVIFNDDDNVTVRRSPSTHSSSKLPTPKNHKSTSSTKRTWWLRYILLLVGLSIIQLYRRVQQQQSLVKTTTTATEFQRPEYSFYYKKYLQEMTSQIEPKPSNGTLDYNNNYSVVLKTTHKKNDDDTDKHKKSKIEKKDVASQSITATTTTFKDFSFYVMGDTPYAFWQELRLKQQMKEIRQQVQNEKKDQTLLPSSSHQTTISGPSRNITFLAHVGDIQKVSKTHCVESTYRNISRILGLRKSSGSTSNTGSGRSGGNGNNDPTASRLPTFVVPGDNDWYDCPNPTQSLEYFRKYLTTTNDIPTTRSASQTTSSSSSSGNTKNSNRNGNDHKSLSAAAAARDIDGGRSRHVGDTQNEKKKVKTTDASVADDNNKHGKHKVGNHGDSNVDGHHHQQGRLLSSSNQKERSKSDQTSASTTTILPDAKSSADGTIIPAIETYATKSTTPTGASITITRSKEHPELFVYWIEGVLFIGVHLINYDPEKSQNAEVGDENDVVVASKQSDTSKHSQKSATVTTTTATTQWFDYTSMMKFNMEWAALQLETYFQTHYIKGVVIFGHALRSPTTRPFFEYLSEFFTTQPSRKHLPVLYIHGDGHNFDIDKKLQHQYHWYNFIDIQVDQGGLADPILVNVIQNEPNGRSGGSSSSDARSSSSKTNKKKTTTSSSSGGSDSDSDSVQTSKSHTNEHKSSHDKHDKKTTKTISSNRKLATGGVGDGRSTNRAMEENNDDDDGFDHDVDDTTTDSTSKTAVRFPTEDSYPKSITLFDGGKGRRNKSGGIGSVNFQIDRQRGLYIDPKDSIVKMERDRKDRLKMKEKETNNVQE